MNKTRNGARLHGAHLFWLFLLALLIGGRALAFSPSFDCSQAATSVEKLICDDPVLSDADHQLADAYRLLRQKRPELAQDQRQWLQLRNACRDAACLRVQYQLRLYQFHKLLQSVNADAPAPPEPAPEERPPAPAPVSPTRAAPYPFLEYGKQPVPLSPEITPPTPAKSVDPAPEDTVSPWQQATDYVKRKSGFLALLGTAILAYLSKRILWLNLRMQRGYTLALNSRFSHKARGLIRNFKNGQERLETQNPMLALFGVLAAAFLTVLVIYGFILFLNTYAAQGFEQVTSYDFKTYLSILWNLLEITILAAALYWLAPVPFVAGVLFTFCQGLYFALSQPFHASALVPLGLEAGLLGYAAAFQREAILAWAWKWRQRHKTLKKFLGGAAYLFLVVLVDRVIAAQHGEWAETLVWIAAIVLFLIWIKKSKLAPETSLFDATLEPEKYFKNDGAVLGWCHCNLPESNPEDDEEPPPYRKAPHVLRYKTDKHFLSIMPNRSGKGRSQIIPNLLQLADWSCWVVDPKGENALVTAPWRRDQGHEIVIFNPYGLWADEFKARGFETFQTFNPLLNLDPQSHRFVGDVDALADALIYKTGGDSHWAEGARGLVSLLIMYLVTEPTETPTFRRLRELIAGGFDSLAHAFGLMRESPYDLVRENVGRYETPSKETEGLIATAETQTGIFRNKTLCQALEGGPFDFEAMKHRRMTVYMILPAEYLVTQARFLRLILLSAMAQFTRSEEGEHRILVLLDEFANLGPLQMVEQGAALISGYGVTLWPFVQNLSQLQKLYPNNWEVFIANAAAITVANVNDVTTAEYFSKRAGKTIKHLWSWSWSSTNGEKGSSTSGHSKTESVQDLLPVEDLYNLWSGAGYVFFEGKAPPLIALKSNYDDRHLPWHDRAANNPMVKVWR